MTSFSQGAVLVLDKPRGANSRAASAVSLDVYKRWCGLESASKSADEDRRGAASSFSSHGGRHHHNKRSRGPEIKMGHAGTLDPMATGCLPVLLGQATRLQDLLPIDEKRYVAHIKLGTKTDSDDADGKVVRLDEAFKGLVKESANLDSVLQGFRGTITQIPPIYSAIHIDGKRAYDLARAGETPTIPPRQVQIHRLSGEILDPFTVKIDVTCGTGTYVRTLGTDIAHALGTEGHLVMLRRVSSGPFEVPVERREVEGDIVRVVSFEEAIRAIAPVLDLSSMPAAQDNLKTGRSGHLFRDLTTAMPELRARQGQAAPDTQMVALQWDNSFRALVKLDFAKQGVISLCHFKPEESIPFLTSLIPRSFEPPLPDVNILDEEIRVVQFNILADGLAGLKPDLGGFSGVPYAAVEWNRRKHGILEELRRAKAHIIGLEELDHFDDIKAALGSQFEGAFKPKRSSPCLNVSSLSDGCGLFFDTTRFKRLNNREESFALGDEANQVACVLVLEDLKSGARYVVCSVHFKALKDEEGVGEAQRVQQSKVLASRLRSLSEEYQVDDVIVCTDLNGTPEGEAYRTLTGEAQFRSSMRTLLGAKEPLLTTAKKRGDFSVQHTIDYIFTSGKSLEPRRHLAIPALNADEFLPSFAYPSDHFMLCVGFSRKQMAGS